MTEREKSWDDNPATTLHMARWSVGKYAAASGQRGAVHRREGPAEMRHRAMDAGDFTRRALSAWAREGCPQASENGAPEAEDHNCSRCPDTLTISERTLELWKTISARTGGRSGTGQETAPGGPQPDAQHIVRSNSPGLGGGTVTEMLYGAIALVSGAGR